MFSEESEKEEEENLYDVPRKRRRRGGRKNEGRSRREEGVDDGWKSEYEGRWQDLSQEEKQVLKIQQTVGGLWNAVERSVGDVKNRFLDK